MAEPTLSPEAITTIDEYVLTLARRSELPFALAEEARRELAAHVTDLAADRARAEGAPQTDVLHVRKAIEAMGNDAGVLTAFFQTPSGNQLSRVPWGRAFLLVLAVFAGFGTIMSLLVTIEDASFEAVLLLLVTTVAATFGAAAIWMLPARWSIASALLVFALPLMFYAAGGHDSDFLFWLWPAIVIALGGIIRSQIPAGARPIGRLAFDLDPYVERLVRNRRRVGKTALVAAAIVFAGFAFSSVMSELNNAMDETSVELTNNVILFGATVAGAFLVGRLRPWIPIFVAAAIFVMAFVLYDWFYTANFAVWAFPAVFLAAAALFAAFYPAQNKQIGPSEAPLTGTGPTQDS